MDASHMYLFIMEFRNCIRTEQVHYENTTTSNPMGYSVIDRVLVRPNSKKALSLSKAQNQPHSNYYYVYKKI